MITRLVSSNSVATQLIRLVFGFYCIIAITITAIQIVLEYQHTEKSIKEELKTNEQVFGQVLSASVWNLDDQQMQNTINGMLVNPIVTGVKIEQDKQILAASGVVISDANVIQYREDGTINQMEKHLSKESFSHSFDVIYEFRGLSRHIGLVTIYSNSAAVLERVEMGIILLVINSIFKTIALWLLFYWIGKRVLIKPLNNLLNTINKVDLKHLDSFKIDLKSKGNTEFNVIESAFGDMVNNLKTTKGQLLDIQQHLENKVKQRTIELKREKEFSTKANDAKSQFMSRISHELNTPLNAIIGSADLLKNRINHQDEESQLFIHNITTAGRHLHLLVQDIMALVQDEKANLPIKPEPVKLHEVVINCINMIHAKAVSQGIHIEFVPHEAHVFANTGRVQQVILNILDNAIKYNRPNGAIRISIIDQNSGTVELKIEDSGIGINPSDYQAIFSPLTRLPKAEQRCIDGLGLGLAVAKMLLDKMKATITVNSNGANKTVFTLSFPALSYDLPTKDEDSLLINNEN